MRFAILLAGIVGAYGIGAVFTHSGRKALADIAACVGSIVFGAAIALVGQMYHLGEDFAAGMILWSAGALVAAVATGSRGALAVALAVGCFWSGARMFGTSEVPHLPFVALWLIAAGLAVAWNSVVAHHLAAAAALTWWGLTQIVILDHFNGVIGPATFASGAALMLGAGLAMARLRVETTRLFGLTLSTYGAFGLAAACAVAVLVTDPSYAPPSTYARDPGVQSWATSCGVVGVVLALAGTAISKRLGPAFAGLASGLVLFAVVVMALPAGGGEPWLTYALLLIAMLCLIVSGMLDGVQPRVVAGWLGLAATIATITWAVRGSLLRRAVFLGIAGLAAVGLAAALGTLMPKEPRK